MERQFPLWLLVVLLLFRMTGPVAGRKVVFGVVGSSVLLDPEYGADLSNSDILWEFTASNKSPVTILDYVPNRHTVEPSEDFKSRLYFNPSDGSLMVNNLKPIDQGVYTVTVDTSAGAEWKRSEDLQLIGLALAHHYTEAFSVAALIIAVPALIGAVVALIAIVAALLFDKMPSLTEHIKITSLEFVRNILQIFQFTPMLTFILLLVAYICWISAEGFSGITVSMWVLFGLHLILTVLLACDMMPCDRKSKILKTKFCRLMMCAANPLAAIIVICASGNLIAEIMKQAGKGCEPAANLQSTTILAVVVPLVLVISLALYLAYTKPKKQTTGPPNADPSLKDPNELQCAEPSLNPGAQLLVKSCLKSGSTASIENCLKSGSTASIEVSLKSGSTASIEDSLKSRSTATSEELS